MKRLTKALLAALLAFAMVIALAPSEGISAKSVKSQNKQAKKLLYQQVKNKYTRYGYVDIDKDGISELVAKEYSGKFVDGCDKLKSVSIYKVIDGKVQQIFTDSIKGDFYHPSIDCEIYFADTVYVIVKKNHEGYFNQIVYRYAGAETGFTEIASVMEDMAGYGSYVINGVETEYEDFDRKAYDSIVVSYAPYKITFELKDCKVKVANKYLKKMLKSELRIHS